MEILTGFWTHLTELTVGGVNLIVLTAALTQAIKGALPVQHKWLPYPVGVIIALIGLGLTWEAVLAGLAIGFLSAKTYDVVKGK